MTFYSSLRETEPQPENDDTERLEPVKTCVMVDTVTKQEHVVQVGPIIHRPMKEAGYKLGGKS